MLRMDRYYGHYVCRFMLKDSLLYLETGKLCDMLSICKPPWRLWGSSPSPEFWELAWRVPGCHVLVWRPDQSKWVSCIKYLDPHWWPCLGRFKRCGLAKGNMSLRTGLEISKATYHSQCSLPCGYCSRRKLSACCSRRHSWWPRFPDRTHSSASGNSSWWTA